MIGVDMHDQPRYPFRFVQSDWYDALAVLAPTVDAVHASPPCQAYTLSTAHLRAAGVEYPDLLADMRAHLQATGLPWVIENVPGAPMRPDYVLCGSMFDLPGLIRHRWFETSWHGFALRSPCVHPEAAVVVAGHGPSRGAWLDMARLRGTLKGFAEAKRRAMGIDWLTGAALSEAVPPAYTEYIGAELLQEVRRCHPTP
jgi:DNA (cytosine-5)-methyltransferase 1